MMYQLLPSSTAVCSGSAGSSTSSDTSGTPEKSSSGSAPSAAGNCKSRSAMDACLLRKCVEKLVDAAAEEIIDEREVRRKGEDSTDDDGCGGADLLPARPRDTAHLALKFLEVALGLRRPLPDALHEI